MAAVLSGALVALMVRLRRVTVEGDSMWPALLEGDRLVLLPTRRPRRGDVVALRHPQADRLLVKRVAAVDHDRVAVVGDNPAASTDSRHFGSVDRRAIVGRAVYRYAPSGREGRLRRQGARQVGWRQGATQTAEWGGTHAPP